jgi:hypothetical protein
MLYYSIRGPLVPSISPGFYGWTGRGGSSRMVSKLRSWWETKWLVPWFDYIESLTCRGLNLNLKHFSCFTFIFVLFGELCLLVSWCAGGRCGIAGSDEDALVMTHVYSIMVFISRVVMTFQLDGFYPHILWAALMIIMFLIVELV